MLNKEKKVTPLRVLNENKYWKVRRILLYLFKAILLYKTNAMVDISFCSNFDCLKSAVRKHFSYLMFFCTKYKICGQKE